MKGGGPDMMLMNPRPSEEQMVGSTGIDNMKASSCSDRAYCQIDIDVATR